MTLAVLCASTGKLDPADAARLADKLDTSLATARVQRIAAPIVDAARIARDREEPLLLCADNLVAHPSLLWTLATEPAGRSTALVVPDPDGDLREDRGRLLKGDGTVRFAGAVCIAPADLPLVTKIATPDDSIDTLLSALLDEGLVPVATRVRLLHAERVHDHAGH